MGSFETAQPPSLADDLAAYLQYMVEVEGSDLFLTVGAVPTVKIEGSMRQLAMPALLPSRVKELAYSMMTESQMRQFEADLECDLAVGLESLGRFRLNVYVQRGQVGMVVRYVKNKIPSSDTNGSPQPLVDSTPLLKKRLRRRPTSRSWDWQATWTNSRAGMRTLRQDALEKVVAGLIDLKQARTVYA